MSVTTYLISDTEEPTPISTKGIPVDTGTCATSIGMFNDPGLIVDLFVITDTSCCSELEKFKEYERVWAIEHELFDFDYHEYYIKIPRAIKPTKNININPIFNAINIKQPLAKSGFKRGQRK